MVTPEPYPLLPIAFPRVHWSGTFFDGCGVNHSDREVGFVWIDLVADLETRKSPTVDRVRVYRGA